MPKPSLPLEARSPEDPYGVIAKYYGACLDPVLIRWKRKALQLQPPQKGLQVLDAGCGTGAQLNLYRSYGCRVFGIDISAAMIAAARRKYNGLLHLCRGDAAGLPYADGTFELVLLSMMLHEISPDARSGVLEEARRVLIDSGTILVVDYFTGPAASPLGRLLTAVITLIEMAAGEAHFRNFRNFTKSGGLPPLLKKHRLAVKRQGFAARGKIGLYCVQKT